MRWRLLFYAVVLLVIVVGIVIPVSQARQRACQTAALVSKPEQQAMELLGQPRDVLDRTDEKVLIYRPGRLGLVVRVRVKDGVVRQADQYYK